MSVAEFLSKERTLGKVIRFGAHKRIRDQNIAEHTFHTALYSMILADMEEKFGNKVDIEKLLRTALIHDLEEAITGDIIYDVKHKNPKFFAEFKRIGFISLIEIMDFLPKEISKKYTKLWEQQKDMSSYEGRILYAADKLEALMYAIEEISLGNKNFLKILKGIKKQLKKANLKSVEIILKELKI